MSSVHACIESWDMTLCGITISTNIRVVENWDFATCRRCIGSFAWQAWQRSLENPEHDSRFGEDGFLTPEHIDYGDDYIFILRAGGQEHWFHVNQLYFENMMSALSMSESAPASELLGQFNRGLGPWGNEPYFVSDVNALVADIEKIGQQAQTNPGLCRQDLIRELLSFIRSRQPDAILVIDDGSGAINRFPLAEEGWTETGEDLNSTIFVRYRHAEDIDCEVSDILDESELAKAISVSEIRDFLGDPHRSYRRLPHRVLPFIASSLPCHAADFLSEANRMGMVVVIQSAGLFPEVPPVL